MSDGPSFKPDLLGRATVTTLCAPAITVASRQASRYAKSTVRPPTSRTTREMSPGGGTSRRQSRRDAGSAGRRAQRQITAISSAHRARGQEAGETRRSQQQRQFEYPHRSLKSGIGAGGTSDPPADRKNRGPCSGYGGAVRPASRDVQAKRASTSLSVPPSLVVGLRPRCQPIGTIPHAPSRYVPTRRGGVRTRACHRRDGQAASRPAIHSHPCRLRGASRAPERVARWRAAH